MLGWGRALGGEVKALWWVLSCTLLAADGESEGFWGPSSEEACKSGLLMNSWSHAPFES